MGVVRCKAFISGVIRQKLKVVSVYSGSSVSDDHQTQVVSGASWVQQRDPIHAIIQVEAEEREAPPQAGG
jgi:hypothetical protein